MRFVFLSGGCVGFATVGAAGLCAGHDTPRVLLDASVGCLCTALLFRWFWSVVLAGVRATLLTRHAAAAAKKKVTNP